MIKTAVCVCIKSGIKGSVDRVSSVSLLSPLCAQTLKWGEVTDDSEHVIFTASLRGAWTHHQNSSNKRAAPKSCDIHMCVALLLMPSMNQLPREVVQPLCGSTWWHNLLYVFSSVSIVCIHAHGQTTELCCSQDKQWGPRFPEESRV